MRQKPRVLFVGRTSYAFPLDDAQRRKWDALDEVLELRVLATGRSDDRRFDLLPSFGTNLIDGSALLRHAPGAPRSRLRAFSPEVVICQSGYETAAALAARRLARSKTAIVAEVHGDWRTLTRLYGSRARRSRRRSPTRRHGGRFGVPTRPDRSPASRARSSARFAVSPTPCFPRGPISEFSSSRRPRRLPAEPARCSSARCSRTRTWTVSLPSGGRSSPPYRPQSFTWSATARRHSSSRRCCVTIRQRRVVAVVRAPDVAAALDRAQSPLPAFPPRGPRPGGHRITRARTARGRSAHRGDSRPRPRRRERRVVRPG